MASNAQIRIDLDSKKAEGSLKDLNKSIKENGKTTENLRTQLRKMTIELQGLEPGTKRFNELTIAAGKLRDQIKDTSAVINATAGSPLENLGTGLATTTDIGIKGFQGIASAMALVSGNDQQLQELFFRLQALQGVVESIQFFGGLGDKLTEIKASFGAFNQSISSGGEVMADYTSSAVEAASAVTDITQSTKTAAAANSILAASQKQVINNTLDLLDAEEEVNKARMELNRLQLAQNPFGESTKEEIDAIEAANEKLKQAKLNVTALKTAQNANTAATEAATVATEVQTASTEKLTIAQKAQALAAKLSTGGWLLLAAGIAAGAYALYDYLKSAEAEEKYLKRVAAQRKAAKEALDKEQEAVYGASAEYVGLIQALKKTNAGSEERVKLIKEINDNYGTTLKNLSDETLFQQQLNQEVLNYIAYQKARYQVEKNQELIQKNLSKQDDLNRSIKKTKDALLAVEEKIRNLPPDALEAGTLYQQQRDLNTELGKTNLELDKANKRLEGYGFNILNAKKGIDDLTNGGKKYTKQTHDQKVAFEESTKALEAYLDALDKDREKPLKLSNYQKEIENLDKGLSALEAKRKAAYEEEKANAEGLYKDKQITKAQYDARLLNAEENYEKQKVEVARIWADKRKEFDKEWTKEQIQISKIANAEAVKATTQSKLDELDAQKALELQSINDSKATQIAKDKAILETQLNYLDKANGLIKEKRDADLVLLEANYEKQIDDINLNEAQKLQITSQYEADKVKINLDANNKIAQNESELTNSIREEFEVRQAAIQEFGAAYDETLSSLGTALTDAISGDFENISDNFKSLSDALVTEFTAFDELSAKWDDLDIKGKVAAIGEAAAQAAQIATDAISAIFEKQQAAESARLEEVYAEQDRKLQESLEAKLVSQEEYDSVVKQNEYIRQTEETRLKRDSFEKGKKVSKANAVIGIANAVIQALSSIPPPASYVAAGVSSVMGAVQLATIDKQKFTAARGGLVPGNGDPNRDTVDALLAPGEMVINSRSSGLFPELLSAINMVGGGIGLAPSTPTAPVTRNSVFGNGGQMRAYVVESDISSSQRRVNRYERNGKY